MELTQSQLAALRHVADYAKSRKDAALGQIEHILLMSNVRRDEYDFAVTRLKTSARVALQFHPDRLNPVMKTVSEALLEDGVYKSQFETRLSSGSLSAHKGGDRDRWESRLFGGFYGFDTSAESERPKYGALDLMRHSDGPAPRFGSCFFILTPEVSSRCTFTYMDSHLEPDQRGTFSEFDDVMAALLTEVFTRDFCLGEHNLTVPGLIRHLLTLEETRPTTIDKPPRRNLNHYIEAQVHGLVLLKDDVELLVADPSFQGSRTGELLEEICRKYDIQMLWHAGFVLPIREIPTDFRGPAMPSLAQRISTEPYINARMIGEAAASLRRNPELWSDRGTYDQVLQELKYLWHVLVRFGHRVC